ncbi:MAG: leucine-rich repeat domain-containing protein, partial [Promethearchaeota archaeon]
GLTYLHLITSSIKIFPESITKLQNLIILKISAFKMTELPSSIKNLHYLEIFEIQHSQFHSIPESIGDLQSLKKIWISNTPISQLPESIGNLHNLESLIIDFYRQNNSQPEIEKIKDYMISRLPESFGNLHNLKKLKIHGVPLTHLPMSFGNLKNLRDLEISNTDLTSLPESFHNFPHLKNLDLSHNQLESLSPVFYPFPALKHLNFWDNSLRSLHFLIDLEKYKCYGGFSFGISELCLTPTGFRLLNAIPEMSRSNFHGDQIYPIRVTYDHHLNYLDDFTFEIDSTNFSNDQVKALYNYYKKSVRELAEQYIDDQDSLTLDERERLVHEASYEWFIVLSANLEPSNSVLKKIQERFQIKRDDGFTILL